MAKEEQDAVAGDDETPPTRKSKKGLLIGLVLALVLGGGGFYAVYSGMVLGGDPSQADTHAAEDGHGDEVLSALPPVAFVPLEPLVISLGRAGGNTHLRFQAQLEVAPAYEQDVSALTPRVLDILNSYLRAVDISDLQDPGALVTLRAQMLRRIQLVTGEGRVRDLLIMEFVLS